MVQFLKRILPRYLKSGTTAKGLLSVLKTGGAVGRVEGGEFHWQSTAVFAVFTVRPSLL